MFAIWYLPRFGNLFIQSAQNAHVRISFYRNRKLKMTALLVISTKWDTCLEWITNWHYPELRGYFTLKSLLHSGLKQVMSLFTLGSTRAVLVVALAYSFPDVFNVIMALISPYTNQPSIVPIRWTSIVS